MPLLEPAQRIARLTPWRDALAAIDALTAPVDPHRLSLAAAVGNFLAEDVGVGADLPPVATAMRDGWAVRADLVADAGPYSPVPLCPSPAWVECGEPLPAGCDAVLPRDAVTTSGGHEAIASAAPAEGVLPRGFDAGPHVPLARAGAQLSATAIAALREVGIDAVQVRRPRVGIAWRGVWAEDEALTAWTVAAVVRAGGEPVRIQTEHESGLAVAAVDALVSLGGTGEGHRDKAAAEVAAVGRLVLHGVGIRPGETAGFGAVEGRPVLLLPGRLDAALGAWLLLGMPLLRRLTGAADSGAAPLYPLTRKVTSSIGLAEAVLVERDGDGVRPVASGAFPLSAIARADGWVLVPPESEGYPSGTHVAVRPLP